MISIECFKGLPTEYESFLIEKYNSFITTCRYIEVYYPTYEINYMLVYENNNIIELFVFGNIGNTSTCFNSLVSIDQDLIIEFTKKIFEIYPSIQKIKILASYQKYIFNKSILFFKSDNHILNLPPTMDDYYLKLGSSTRQHIKNRKVRLLRDYQNVNFVAKFGAEIDETIIDNIIQLNVDRMKHKGKIPGINQTYKNNIFKYSQHYGCVAYIEIDGKIVAGNISTILNNGIFGHVTAHDNNFSKYSVGEICAFYLIQTVIEKGLLTFHFLWGESDLKKRLLAKPHLLFSYVVYRAYSSDYFYRTVIVMFSNILIDFQNSKFSRPLKNLIKFYRKKNWKV